MRALIAGQGALPTLLAEALDPKPVVCSLHGFEPDVLRPDHVFRLETLGTLLTVLKENGVRDVTFAGRIRRPEIDPQLIDAATKPLVPVLQRALTVGDDGALRAVLGIFEDTGFVIRGAHEICPDLTLPTGVPSDAQPSERNEQNAIAGERALMLMSEADVGQACIVHKQQVVTFEGAYGTDWMLESMTRRPDGSGGVLVKAPKQGQDLRVDMPTIGPDTVTRAHAAGLDGIVIKAGQVLVLEREDVLKRCNELNLFLWSKGS
ncbi:MAG: LpxI family protein [Arenibacterium sp.]